MKKKLLLVLALVFGFFPIWIHGLVSNSTSSSSPESSLIPLNSESMETLSPAPGILVSRDADDTHLPLKILIGLAAAASALAALIVSMICLWMNRRYSSKQSSKSSHQESDVEKGCSLGSVSSQFSSVEKKGRTAFIDYKLLESGTNSFGVDAALSKGKWGCVYKAQLDDDTPVAVKRIKTEDLNAERQFENELDLLSKVRHPNIISLRGYSVHENMRLLVYEFIHNGSLETQLNGPTHGSALSWHKRMKIALDTARGLEYLHEHCNPQVIHRNLNPSNILLDSKFNAKLTGFGLAMTANACSMKLPDTPTYIAPEYLLDGKLTEKSDVYAFGVILLELLLGRKPVADLSPGLSESIATWAMPQVTDRSKLPNIVDAVIRDTMDVKHLYQVAAVAVLCVQQEPTYRPLITDVLHSLVPLVPAELGGSARSTGTATELSTSASL